MSEKIAVESETEPMLLQRRICLSFCATVLVGVLLCAVYLGSRSSWLASRVKTSTGAKAQRNFQVNAPPAPPPQRVAPAPAIQVSSPPPPAVVSRPATGTPGDTYLQIAALDRGMSEVLVEVLRRKGFEAAIAVGATEDIFRVVVGPMKDAAALVRVKADLQAAGFTSFPRKTPKLIAYQRQEVR